MSCGCCAHERRGCCSNNWESNWGPTHKFGGFNAPLYGGYNRSFNTFNQYEGYGYGGFNNYNRQRIYFGRAYAGYYDPLFGRIDAGGFNQPDPNNDDGDQ